MARLPLSAETGDISRVERFRWIVLEAAAGELMYRGFLGENRGTNGGLMEFLVSIGTILVRLCPEGVCLVGRRTRRQFEQPQAAGSYRVGRCRRVIFPRRPQEYGSGELTGHFRRD